MSGGARPATTAKIVTSPLLENTYVLSTGQFGAVTAAQYSNLTVLVSPDEAKLLIWAMKLGELTTNESGRQEYLEGLINEFI